MSTKYVNFRTHKRGVKKANGEGRHCMNCSKGATATAVKKTGYLSLNVWLCSDHEIVAREYNAS